MLHLYLKYGRRNVNKLGDMTMTAFGYSDQEVCVCCPCLPASQVLLFIAVPFYFFNWLLDISVSPFLKAEYMFFLFRLF